MTALVIGRRRMGKSTLSLSLALASQFQAGNKSQTVVVFDPNLQYASLPWTGNYERLERFLEATQHAENGAMNAIAFRPGLGTIEGDFAALCDVLWSWNDYTLIVDEASVVQRSQWIHPSLERLIRQSPNGVSVVLSTHRLTDVHRLVRSQATDTFFFRTSNAGDLKLISDEYGDSVRKAVESLGRWQCVHHWLDAGGEERFTTWEDSAEWFIDLENENTIRDSRHAGN